MEPGTRNLEPVFEVITNQPAILAELWANARPPVTAEVVAPNEARLVSRDIELAAVEINPVVVKWLVEPPPAPGFPLPFIVRIAAEAARRPE